MLYEVITVALLQIIVCGDDCRFKDAIQNKQDNRFKPAQIGEAL